MILLRQVPNVVGSTEEWELYTVTGGVVVRFPNIMLPVVCFP
jgi:hypothetical protein